MMKILLLILLITQVTMGSISISNINGKRDIYINNQKVDLNEAKVIEKTDDYTVYQPKEDEDTTIVIGKDGGVMISSNGSVQVSTQGSNMSPAEKKQFQQKMQAFHQKMDQQRQEMTNKLSHLKDKINERVKNSLSNMYRGQFFEDMF
ncbi:uncharacterized protein isoform X2 [Rhodnius prolixus]|uniref:uncharacterized protein isoform X2 n=1 Tax=Rhodnius prolixus TaxID=13249 RepID=UPI003D18D69B